METLGQVLSLTTDPDNGAVSCCVLGLLHAQNMNCLVFIKLLQPIMDPLVIAREVFTDMVTTKASRTRCVGDTQSYGV